MGKASSAKKVARAARAGSSRRIGQRRHLGFPVTVTVIIVLGVLLVWFARDEREAVAEPQTTDHWHAAYGTYLCDHFADPLTDIGSDALGIHTHGEGIVHIHPFLNSAAGTNAKTGIFFDQVGLDISNDQISLPSGESMAEDDDQCDGEDAIVQVAKWNSAEAAAAGEKPDQIFTDDFRDIRFTADREAFTIAFLPEGADIPAPESIPTLDDLSDVIQAPSSTTSSIPDSSSTTSTTAPGDTTSSTPPSSDTTTTSTG